MTLFRAISFLMSMLVLGIGVLCGFALPKAPALATRIPRLRLPGALLGTALLAYCAYEGALMLPGTRWGQLFWALVPVTAFLCWYFMDFLMARALGGLLVIIANFLIQNAFGAYCGCRPLYASVALAWGVAGTLLIAWPWWFRDVLTACSRHLAWRIALLLVSVFSCIVFLVLPLMVAG